MQVCAHLPLAGRDLRLDLFRGLANWAIFLDHIPHEVLSWVDNPELWFQRCGRSVCFHIRLHGRLRVRKSNDRAGLSCSRVKTAKARFGTLCRAYHRGHRLYRRCRVRLARPSRSQRSGCVQRRRFHPQTAVGIRPGPGFAIQARQSGRASRLYSVVGDVCSGAVADGSQADADLDCFDGRVFCREAFWLESAGFSRSGVWYFNPFAWQLLFFLGAWIALGGADAIRPIVRTRTVFWLAIAYLVFAVVVTMAIHSPDFGNFLPSWVLQPFDPNDKTNLAPYRIVHLLALAVVVTRFLPADSPILQWRSLVPLIKCGQNSLKVFCIGIVLSFCAHAAIELSLNSLWVQICRRHRRCIADDGGRLLLDLVQTTGSHASFACPLWRHRVTEVVWHWFGRRCWPRSWPRWSRRSKR